MARTSFMKSVREVEYHEATFKNEERLGSTKANVTICEDEEKALTLMIGYGSLNDEMQKQS